MKNNKIDKKIQAEIIKACETDPHRLSLTFKGLPEEDRIFIARQVACRQKVRDKIPDFYRQEELLYPSGASIEQASSTATAQYKSQLVKGGTLIDITGGLGVDSYYFSKSAGKVIYVEKNRELVEYAHHNFRILGVNNVDIIHEDGIDYISKMEGTSSCIYIDPSRRRASSRIFKIEDADPNVLVVYDQLLVKTERMLIKLSPLIDLKYITLHFRFVYQIHIVAVNNDCKEIILLLDRHADTMDPQVISYSNEKGGASIFKSSLKSNKMACGYDNPQQFLYDPNIAIRKSGLFNDLGNQYKLKKLAANSHLFTDSHLLDDFPGRVFVLKEILTWKELLRTKKIRKANIATRNFHLRVSDIRKITGIKEGGDEYIFCTTSKDNKTMVLVTEKADYKK